MGQTPSKKMGRTRSKELSGNDLSEAMASHTIRGDGPDSAAGTSPGGGGLSGSAPIDVGPASPRGAGGKRGASGKGPEKQGSVSSLSSAAALGSSLGRANSPYDAASVRSSNSTGGDKALAPNVPANNTIAASPRSGLRSSLLGSSPPPSLSVPGSSPGNLATSPPASPGGRDLSPVNALTATISRNSMAGAGGQVLDVDNMISRLIEAGYSGKVTKSPPLKIAEINAVCLAAREVFLSQPTLIELSPPVKIVGDVHGQVRIKLLLCQASRERGVSSRAVRRSDPSIRNVRFPPSSQLSLPRRLCRPRKTIARNDTFTLVLQDQVSRKLFPATREPRMCQCDQRYVLASFFMDGSSEKGIARYL